MQEYTVTRYSFPELGESARETAIKRVQERLWECIEAEISRESAISFLDDDTWNVFTIDGEYAPVTVTNTSEVA